MLRRAVGIVILASVLGCLGTDDHSGDAPGDQGDPHAGHNHGEATGPHGGHILELGEEEYHVEWTHNDDMATITVYVLDAAMEKAVTADSAKITTKVKDRRVYALERVEFDGESFFELKNGGLLTTLRSVGEGVKANIEVVVDGKTFNSAFEEHVDDH